MTVTGIDLWLDRRAGSSTQHMIAEGAIAVTALVGLALIWLHSIISLRGQIQRSEADLQRTREDAARWHRQATDLLAGLGAAIDDQLERWGLTQSEKEVALLLLKGLSSKEIAGVRGVAEKTVRHQALAIYRKSGLGGRAELAAFFLEDLLLPMSQREASPPAP